LEKVFELFFVSLFAAN